MFVGLLVMGATPAWGQSTGTVLNADFAGNLADPELNWPTTEGISTAQARDVTYAKYDAARWQNIILAAPFHAVAYGERAARDEGSEFTGGVSAGGYDAVYYRWETSDYRLQFRCTRWLMSIMVEPKSVATRPKVDEQEVRRRTTDMVSRVVSCGTQLVANSTMKLQQTPYGYGASFKQTAEQSNALERLMSERDKSTWDAWLVGLTVRTDGYSFVFDFPKIGVGPLAPEAPVTTTQPGVKTWFKPRQAPDPNSP